MVAILLCAAHATGRQGEEVLMLLGDYSSPKGFDVYIKTTDRTSMAGPDSGSKYSSGSGDIYVRAFQKEKKVGRINYSQLLHSSQAQSPIKVTGGTYKFTADTQPIKGILPGSVGFTIKKDTVLSVMLRKVQQTDVRYLRFEETTANSVASGGLEVALNMSSDDPAKPGQVKALIKTLDIEEGGTFKTAVGFQAKDVQLLYGIRIVDGSFTASFERSVQNNTPTSKFSVDGANAQVTVAIPLGDLALKKGDELWVTASGFSIDEEGQPSCANFSLSLNNDSVLYASTGLFNLAPARKLRDCLNPSNFGVEIKGATGKITNGLVTGTINLDWVLPVAFGTKPEGDPNRGRVKISDITVTLSAPVNTSQPSIGKPNVTITFPPQASAIDVYWKKFHLSIPAPASGSGPNVALDLDPNAKAFDPPTGKGLDFIATPSWMGLYIKKATLELPDQIGTIGFDNCVLDSAGISGSVSLQGNPTTLKLPGLNSQNTGVTSVSISFLKNAITDFRADGYITLTNLSNTKLNLSAGLTNTGTYFLTVDPTDPVTIQQLGLQLQIDKGSIQYTNQVATFLITGTLGVPDNTNFAALKQLKGFVVTFQDVGIDTNGDWVGGQIGVDLPTPKTIRFGPVAILVDKFALGAGPSVTLTGGVSIASLPVSGGIGFDGLEINGGSGTPTVSLNGLTVDIDVPKVGRISGSLNSETITSTTGWVAKNQPWTTYFNSAGNQPVNMIKGKVDLFLNCFGPAGAGIGIDFLASKDGWYVGGTASISTAIKLGNTGLELHKFMGAIAKNILPKDTTVAQIGVPAKDYDIVPRPPGMNQPDAWIVSAGVGVRTLDQYTLWGELVLTASFGNGFWIDLDGKCYLLTAANPPAQDRLIHGNIHYDAALKEFLASLSADLNFPTKANPVIAANGTFRLQIDERQIHFQAGDALSVPDFGQPSFTNPVSVTVTTPVGQAYGQLGMDVLLKYGPDTDHKLVGSSFDLKFGMIVGMHFGAEFGWEKLNVAASADITAWCGLYVSKKSSGTSLSGALGFSAAASFTGTLGPINVDVSGGVAAVVGAKYVEGVGFAAKGRADAWLSVGRKDFSLHADFEVGTPGVY
ncbi:MAG: hypothetical protein HZC36_04410 [Armatimonadetes bacterium]|nr:hypothetical protein [Armatimonadota bacterium]